MTRNRVRLLFLSLALAFGLGCAGPGFLHRDYPPEPRPAEPADPVHADLEKELSLYSD